MLLMEKNKWSISITPRHNLFKLDIKELIEYKDLIFLFVKRDFVTVYRQTVFGPLWHLIQPLITSFTFYILFSRIAKMGTHNVPPILFYMSALVMWNFFSSCVGKSSSVFIANATIFGKVYFPRLTVPLSFMFSNIISFAFQLFFLLVIIGIYHFRGYSADMHWSILLTPFILLIIGVQGTAMGMLISTLTTKYRDLVFLVNVGIQLLMYLSPVIYTLDSLEPQLKEYMIFNPMAPCIEFFRYSVCGAGAIDVKGLAISIAITLVLAIVAVITFNKTEKDFIDTV